MLRFFLRSVAVLCVGSFGGTASAAEPDYDRLADLYFHLHANPELSYQEEASAARMAAEMQQAGFTVTEKVGGHGVVGVMENGDGPTVLIRADMDGLPVHEQTGLPYASVKTAVEQTGQEVFVMHACGHDVHMTVLAGTAHKLASMRNQWRGTLVLIAQPAEERGGGSIAMLDDGLFTRFPRPDFNLSLHVSADLPAGKVGYVSGWAMANVDSVDIYVKGIGGHGAYPHLTKDPIVLSSQIVVALQTLVSREITPSDPGVVTVGAIHGGAKHNVIPDEVHMQLTVRSYSDEVRQTLISGIKRIAENQARAAGLPDELLPVVKTNPRYTPALYNDPDLTARVTGEFAKVLGTENVVEVRAQMGGEDFARYGRQDPAIPSLQYRLGTIDPAVVEAASAAGRTLPSLHSSRFAPLPAPTIKTGVETMSAAALELLAR